jgi:hypothetical protein
MRKDLIAKEIYAVFPDHKKEFYDFIHDEGHELVVVVKIRISERHVAAVDPRFEITLARNLQVGQHTDLEI